MRTCVTIALFVLLAACQQAPVTSTAKEDAKDQEVKQYPMHGEVLRLDPQGKIAAIKAGKIGDWMEAMTMEYPIKDQADFDKLRAGEKINATVYVQGNSYWVGGIQAEASSSPAPSQTPAPESK
jgi:Cu/Ag efflux protein CusF